MEQIENLCNNVPLIVLMETYPMRVWRRRGDGEHTWTTKPQATEDQRGPGSGAGPDSSAVLGRRYQHPFRPLLMPSFTGSF